MYSIEYSRYSVEYIVRKPPNKRHCHFVSLDHPRQYINFPKDDPTGKKKKEILENLIADVK